MTDTGHPSLRTWIMRSPKAGMLTVTLTVDSVLTVILAPPGVPERRDERKLKDYAGALRYIEQFVLEREVRGFRLISDSYRDQLAAEAKAKADADAAAAALLPPVDAAVARVTVAGAVQRAGWVAVSCERRIDDALMNQLLTADTDTLQLVCEGEQEDDDDDEEDEEDEDEDEDEDDEPDHHALSVRCFRRVAASPRPSLRTLILDTHAQTITRQVDEEHGNRWGDLSVVFNALTSLERVYAAGLFWLRKPLACQRLQQLTLVSSELGDTLVGLHKSTLPVLSHLGLAGSGDDDIDDFSTVALSKLLRSKALPALTHLDVDSFGDPVAVLEAAARRPLQVVRVGGALGDEDDALPRLLKLAKAYPQCEVRLALDTLSEEGLATLHKAWPGLIDDDNHDLFLPSRYQAWT
jgi:hypothetical protein